MNSINMPLDRLKTLTKLSKMINQLEMIEQLSNPQLIKLLANVQKLSSLNNNIHKAVEIQNKIYEQLTPSYIKLLNQLNGINRVTDIVQKFYYEQNQFEYRKNIILQMAKFDEVTKLAEKEIAKEDIENISQEDIEGIPQEEYMKMCEVVEEVVLQKENWQQRVMNEYEQFKKKNPLLAKVFVWLLAIIHGVIIGVIAGVILQQIGKTDTDTKLKQYPSSHAPIIVVIEKNTVVNIVGEVPYYYEVMIEEAANNQVLSGWVSKRSISVE